MKRQTIVRLAGLAVALAIGSFLVLGTTRLLVGVETARLLAAPLFAGGFVVASVVFVLSLLVKFGIVTVED